MSEKIDAIEQTNIDAVVSADELASQERLDVFSKFLSKTLLTAIVDHDGAVNHAQSKFSAAVLFADVSGFTNLTEKLMNQYGQEPAAGAEHLTFMLSDYFDHLVAVVEAHDGDVIKFAGDAMLIMFPCSDAELALRRACACGVEMQKVAKEVSARLLEQHKVILSLKVAVSYGEVIGLTLGGVLGRWEYAVISDAIADVGRLGDVAQSHDVLISDKKFSLIKTDTPVKEVRDVGVFNLKTVPQWDLAIESHPIELSTQLESVARGFVPAAVASRIAAGQSETSLLSELRRVSVLFINLPQFTTDIELERAQKIVTSIQQACYGQRGSLDKISCDDKGVSIIAGFGVPPMSAEDDATRAVTAAMNIKTLLNSMSIEVSIGVATGPVYCGTLGDQYRREYTIMGDGVNTAARLMGIAKGGVLCDSNTMVASKTDIEFAEDAVFKLKGKDESVKTFRPLSLTRTNAKADVSIIGRTQELAVLSDAYQGLQSDKQTRCVIIEGEAGMGKSVLVEAFAGGLSKDGPNPFFLASASNVQISFYGVWRELLYQALGFSGLSDKSDKEDYLHNVAEKIDGVRAEVLPLLNDVLGLSLPETDFTAAMQNEIRAENIRFLIARMLQRQAQGKPLIMVIDDAQWMDSASWILLDSLVRDLDNILFIVLTQPFVGENPASLDQLYELDLTDKVSLLAMSKADIAALVCYQLGVSRLPDAILDLILERAEGHPLYSEVLANDLSEREIINIEDGVCKLAPGISSANDIELPSSIESAIVSRLERLSLDQQLTLKTASVIGRRFSMRVLDYIYPVDNDRESLNTELDALSSIGMTQPQIRHVDYFFKQLATQKIAYGLVLYSQRKKLHRQVAQWMELNSSSIANKYPDMARHWQRAEEPAKAIKYLELAAEKAYALFANRETLEYLERIEKILSKRKIHIPPFTRARWKEMSGNARLTLGDLEGSERDFRDALSCLGIDLPKTTLGYFGHAIIQILKQVRHRFLPALDTPVRQEKVAETHLAARIMERYFVVIYFLENVAGLFFASFAATNLSESTADSTEALSKSYSNLATALGGIPLIGLSASYFSRAKEAAIAVDMTGSWAWYYLLSGMAKGAVGDWSGHDKAMLEAQQLAKEQGDRRRWEESAAVYAIGGLTYGNFHKLTEEDHIYQRIHASAYSRGVYQSQSWGFCMWTISAIVQGRYDIANKVATKLEKLYLEHADSFEPINVLEASTSFSLLAMRDGKRERVIHYLDIGNELVSQWGRPTTWRSIPCAYAQAETSLRFWYQETLQHGAKIDPRFKLWVTSAIKNVKAHGTIYEIAKSRYELLSGWYQLMSGKPKAAAKHWKNGLRLARQFNMKFDLLVISLAVGNLDDSLSAHMVVLNHDEVTAYASELNMIDLSRFRDWRILRADH